MGASVNSGNVTAIITSGVTTSLPSPTVAQTIIQKGGSGQANGATIHTVTAGKTFYCTMVLIAGSGAGTFGVTATGVSLLNQIVGSNDRVVITGGCSPLFSVASTGTVLASCSAGTGNIYISGWEQ
jgi:hypothetical protein